MSYRSKTSHSAFPILCIPRVYDNITEERIRRVFNDLNMGTLSHIDIVPKVNAYGEKFNRVFVHYREWNNSPNSVGAQVRLLEGKEIKIIYDDPWFWKISAYREKAPTHSREKAHPQIVHRPKATIQFDDEEDNHLLPIAPRLPSPPRQPLPQYKSRRQQSPPPQRQHQTQYRSRRQQSPPPQRQHQTQYRSRRQQSPPPQRPRSPNYPPPEHLMAATASASSATATTSEEVEEVEESGYYEEGECDEEEAKEEANACDENDEDFQVMYGDLDDDEVEEAVVVLPPVTVNYGTNLVVPNRKPKTRAR